MYKGSLLGLRYGQYFSENKLNVTSRKSACARLHSKVILRPHDLKDLEEILFETIKLDESASAFMFDLGEPFNHCPCI